MWAQQIFLAAFFRFCGSLLLVAGFSVWDLDQFPYLECGCQCLAISPVEQSPVVGDQKLRPPSLGEV